MLIHGYERTVCACESCRTPCRHMPGFLAHGDIWRLADAMGIDRAYAVKGLRRYLLASDGALVLTADGEALRIPTLVPDRNAGGCVFLDAETGHCRVHANAPYGCGWFDMHMSAAEGNARSATALRALADAWRNPNDPYALLWRALAKAGRTSSIAQTRAALKAAT